MKKASSKLVKMEFTESKNQLMAAPDKSDLAASAKYLEQTGDLKAAAKLYEKLLRQFPLKELNYNRLLLIYRKNRDYENELRVIDKGIKVFSDYYQPSPAKKNKKVIALSKKLSLLTGLTDKKGNNLFDAEPVAKWKKRREIVLKKME